MAPANDSGQPPVSDSGQRDGSSSSVADNTEGLRRSARARKPQPSGMHAGGAGSEDELASSTTTREPSDPSDMPRRETKRRASSPEMLNIPDDLLEAALAPVRPDELEQWEGWITLESDPAFFNVILQELGVGDVKIQELFSVDEGSLALLPKPVHGLIFLYEYVGEMDDAAIEDTPEVWFANQTTSNACATVALLNIVMNAQDIELGDNLRDFKAETASMEPPLRGWLLANNKSIRKVHNSFARRLDLLNCDLVLDNAVDEAKKMNGRAWKRKKTTRRKHDDDDAAYHFIAYVPVGGKVYQLDGLESKPLPIGDYTDDWTSVARPAIEARMLQHSSEQLSFNLLALCQSPLSALRRSLIPTIQALSQHDPGVAHPASLREFGLTAADLAAPAPPPAETGPAPAAVRGEYDRLRAEYVAELAQAREDALRVEARREDYTLFIHTWVRMLAEKGVLRELKEGTHG